MTKTNQPISDLPFLLQNLQPLGIFALNRLLREMLRELQNGHEQLLAPDRLSMTPVVFNKQNRTFHFAAVQGEGWSPKGDSIQEFLGNLKELVEFEEQLKSEMGALSSQYPYSEALETLCRVIKAYAADTETWLGSDGPEFVEALHTVYYGMGASRNHYLPGILYKRLNDSSARGLETIEWFSSGLAKLVEGEAPIYPGKFFGKGSSSLCDEEKDYFQESDRNAIVLRFIRKFHREGQLDLNKNFETGPVLLMPVRDTWIQGEGFGGLWAALICTFAGEEPDKGIEVKECFERKVMPDLLPRFETISNVLFNAGIAAIANEDLAPPYNLAEHFVRALTHVQDWECVKAYYGDEVEFCYRRSIGNRQQEWLRCDKPPCRYCTANARRFSWGELAVSLWDRKYVPQLTQEDISQYKGYSFEFNFSRTSLVPNDNESRRRFDWAVLRQQMNVLGVLAPKVRALRYALRRAVSGIMGRNLSHNIGSHVIARYASKIGTDEVFHGNNDDQRSDLLHYLQRRMDFLADVATSDSPFWFQSLSLKEQTDRLNWEEQTARLNRLDADDQSGPVATSGRQAEPVLLRFITGKENLNATVDYSGDDVYFACPGGEVGVHALFVILENIIRNSARHGSAEGDKPVALEVSLCERDQDSDLLKLEIVDHCSLVQPSHEVTLMLAETVKRQAKVKVRYTRPTGNGVKAIRTRNGEFAPTFSVATADGADNADCACDTNEPMLFVTVVAGNSLVLTFDKELDTGSTPAKEAFFVTADDNPVKVSMVTIEKRLDERINVILKDPILTSDGEPKAENWGIREMQICAHYLRGFSLFDLESAPVDNCPVLEAGCHHGKLKYTIYLERAKRMAVVRKQQGETNSEEAKELERQGVKIIEPTKVDWSVIGAEVGSYEYLVVSSDFGKPPDNPRDRAAVSLPVRCLELLGTDIGALTKNMADGSSLWMEPLHKRWTELIRNRRDAWLNKDCFGVSIRTSDGALPEPACPWPKDKTGTRLIFTSKDPTDAQTKPLPREAESWLERLSEGAIAAAWVDHAREEDFSPRHGGLGQSSRPVHRGQRLWISAEIARSGDPNARFLKDAYEARKSAEWEILAAAVSRVAVLDERVQSAGSEGSSAFSRSRRPASSGKKRRDIWCYMGVWTPPKEPPEENEEGCDLDKPDFDQCRKFLKNPAKRGDQYPIDILVVHLTILERLARDRDESLGKVLHCLLEGTEAEDAEVVVVTGRGVPSVARAAGGDDGSALEGVRYLPISALLESLVARPSKLAFMRILWSACVPASRRPGVPASAIS